MKKQEKVYCKNCKYCGDIVYATSPGHYMSNMPRPSINIFYMHGVEVAQRYCKNHNVPNSEEYHTFYKKIKNNFTPMCHEINEDNNCKYYKKKNKHA